ncbi:MAG: PEP-CTERM sorting domain-containing protein [Pirellulaceae bacterium]|nr:PEP-CTERM sorting domain-containing protein [Pirellulaceae bacterium]
MREKFRGLCPALLAALAVAVGGGVAHADYASVLNGMGGLVSYWDLNEASGTTAADQVEGVDGYNTGTFSGTGYSRGVAGPRPTDGFLGFAVDNLAANFTGNANTKLQMVEHAVYAGMKDASLITWVQFPVIPTSSSTRRTVGGLQRTGSAGRYILCSGIYDKTTADANGGLQGFVRRENDTATTNVKQMADINQWHMWALTFEDGQIAKSYLDGQLVETFDFGDSFGLETPTGLVFGLDVNNPPGSAPYRPWLGQLDEIAMFTRALTEGEVGTLWTVATTGVIPEPTSFMLLGIGLVFLAGIRRRQP